MYREARPDVVQRDAAQRDVGPYMLNGADQTDVNAANGEVYMYMHDVNLQRRSNGGFGWSEA